MINAQGNQGFAKEHSPMTKPLTLHLHRLTEPVLLQKFMGRLMQNQTDPAQLGQQISQILLANLAPETLLPKIAEVLGAACQGDCCLVAAVKGDRTTIQSGYWETDRTVDSTEMSQFPKTTPVNKFLVSLTEHPAFGRMLLSGGSVAISDIQTNPATRTLKVESLPFRGILAIATRLGGAVNGTIVVGSLQPRLWSTLDLERLEAIATMAAIAISQLEKTQEIATLQQVVHRQSQYQTLLSWLTCIIDTPLELNQILQLAIEGTADTLQVDRGLILLLKYADPLFKTHSPNQIPKAKVTIVCEWFKGKGVGKWRDAGDREIKSSLSSPSSRSSFWLSESSLCQEAFSRARKLLAIADTNELPNQSLDYAAEILKPPGIRALLLVPLVGATQGTILGFLVLQHSLPRLWQPEELELVELVAAQISAAILQTQTLQQVQALVEDRTAQLQRSLDVQAKLYEQTRRQVDQLRLLNQLKDEFLSTVSHELRTPLTSMTLAIRMLRQSDLPPERRAVYLDILDRQCSQETNLINDLLALQQLESQPDSIEPEKIDLKLLIADLAQDFEQKWASKSLTLAVEIPGRPLPLQTEPKSLRRILLELLTNAGKYSAASSTVVLAAYFAAGEIVISVSNIGRGISSEDLPHIFEKFRRGAGITEQAIPGTGLGLALVKSLVKHLRGTIAAFSSGPAENPETNELWRTSFTLTLPLFPGQNASLEE
ncbi:GAF domain-containing sensor histidine kinase [Kamptonema sp. UHCC 0994]|uniref:GAF domain-containing sensor histidine kinase n=1 Tax=Kamptonema sp. UHCC 0994 TaxID=3031329 RepID=UPI0023B89285|nr:GAF domain-containing sensor histidine kinase [Kamptonema sp. UHCC 0994]MDF0554686.1 GAF domain-containing sensor histidine kinase [Kamptonema sp. UHCC 0994]